jgi:hypothetical protein
MSTFDDLYAVWKSVTDSAFVESLEQVGDGNGLEVYGQLVQQLSRVSEAVSKTTSSIYILPNSGQEYAPASGAVKSTVTLSITRTSGIEEIVILGNKLVWFEEWAPDWGEEPGEVGSLRGTGRLYTPQQDLLLIPGIPSMSCIAEAQSEGDGFNNPLPGTITTPREFTLIAGSHGTISNSESTDVFTDSSGCISPSMLGSYIRITSSESNIGRIARVIGTTLYSSAILERTKTIVGTWTGAPMAGELFEQGVRTLQLLASNSTSAFVRDDSGGSFTSAALTGRTSGAVFTPASTIGTLGLIAESNVGWTTVQWSEFGLTSNNTLSPSGGSFATLDSIGDERGTHRKPGESDSSYRQRVAGLPDVVSPNAVLRAINTLLSEFGMETGLREAGTTIPGIYCDVSDIPCAFDLDAVIVTGTDSVTGMTAYQLGFIDGEEVRQTNSDGQIASGMFEFERGSSDFDIVHSRGTFVDSITIVGMTSNAMFTPIVGAVTGGLQSGDRYRYAFDPSEERAFFLLEVPQGGSGEFGCGLDDGGDDYLDIGFSDGFPVTQLAINKRVFSTADECRAAGVVHSLIPS